MWPRGNGVGGASGPHGIPVTQLLNPREAPVLLHFCLGAFALASETFFPLPLLGWMPLMVS